MKLHGYPKILALGHRYLDDLFKDPVLVEEKVDGSQFSFGKDDQGNLFFRSKGAELFPPITDKLFKAAVEYIESVKDKVRPGYVYRGEVLRTEKHNALAYGRVPKHNVIIFDIDIGIEKYIEYSQKKDLAEELDLEVVPALATYQTVTNVEDLKQLLNTESCLSSELVRPKIEGIVIKNYNKFGKDGKALMGKWVREEFKEMASKNWKNTNPGKQDMIETLIDVYRTETRWNKSIQHLREEGKLQNDPKDIGILLAEIQKDVHTECSEEIKEKIFKWAWKKISRGITRGFPEHYKKRLAEAMFEKEITDGKEKETTAP